MANIVEPSDLISTRFVLPTSRYASSQVIRYSEQRKLTFEIYKRGEYVDSPKDKYLIITSGIEYRPDLLSYQFYGTVDFWWKILEANGMRDVFDFKTGTNIRLPNNIF